MNAFSLVFDLGEKGLKRFDLSEDKISIGRAPTNDVQVLVHQMSVHHAEVVFLGKTYGIIDKGSTNGTEVNHTPVGAAGIELNSMDQIVFGGEVDAFYILSAVIDNSPVEDVVADIRSAATKSQSGTTTAELEPASNTVRLRSIRPARTSKSSGPIVAATPPTGGIPMALPSASSEPIHSRPPRQTPQPVPLQRPQSAGPAPVVGPPPAANKKAAPQRATPKPAPIAPPPKALATAD